jgi:uncharacterized delta-60 repeat protein
MRRFRVALVTAASLCTLTLARCSGDDKTACDGSVCDVTLTPLTVALTPAEIWVHPSDAKTIAVAIARGPNGTGDVSVTIETDAGFSADPLTIADGKTDGTLVVHVPPSFSQGQATLVVDAQTPTALAQAPLVVHVAGASGTLDTSFGAKGVADLSPGNGQDFAHALIALQSGVLVGTTHVEAASSMQVLRLNASGGVDSSFAITTTPGELSSLAMLPDGRVFAVGDVRTTKADFAAVRILAAGGLDPTYAVDTSISLADDLALAAAIEPGGRLVAAGSASGASMIALARYTQVPLPVPDAGADADADTDANTDAATDADANPITSHLDPTFGDGGIVTATLTPTTGARALLVAGDGSLFALGFANGDLDTVALHFGTDGTIDGAFGEAGVARMNSVSGAVAALLEPSGDVMFATRTSLGRVSPAGIFSTTAPLLLGATSVARDPASGAIYVAGASGTQCAVARYTPAFTLDATFANAGTLSWTSGDTCVVAAVAVDGDGKLVALQTITSASASHAAVSRFWP